MLDELSSQVLERLSFGLIVCAPDGKVLLSNPMGEPWVRRLLPRVQGDPAAQRSQGKWRLSRPFREMLAAACSPGASMPAQAAQVRDDKGQVASIIVLPLPPSHRLAEQWQRPAALVAVRAAGDTPPLLTPILRELYGLTPAENRLATLLAAGIGLPDACAKLGIHHETGRTQLKTIFNKTETSTQAQLACLLTELSASVSLR